MSLLYAPEDPNADPREFDRLRTELALDAILGVGDVDLDPAGRAPTAELIERSAMARDFGLGKEDAEAFVEELKPISLLKGLESLLKAARLRVYCEPDRPQIAPASLNAWRLICNRLDQDCLLTFVFAKAEFDRLEHLSNWGLVAEIAARDLAGLADQGVADLHVHIGGLRSPSLLWLQLMEGRFKLDHLAAFKPAPQDRLSVGEKAFRSVRTAAMALAAQARYGPPGEDGGNLAARFAAELRHSNAEPPETAIETRLDPRLARILWIERRFLLRAFAKLLARGEAGAMEDDEEARLLRLYVATKSRFVTSLHQATETNVGLGAYRVFHHAGARPPHRSLLRPGPLSAADFAQHTRAQLTESLAAIAPSLRRLRRLELRCGPVKGGPQAYLRWLRSWTAFEQEHEALFRGLDLDVRFAIHFKRSLGRSKDKLERFRIELDRDSAELHLFRRRAAERAPELLPLIARVDFAGQERDLPPQEVVFALNLLRGDQRSLHALKRMAREAERAGDRADWARPFEKWLFLHRSGEAKPPIRSSALGVTCHAGEDYAHVVEGLFAIDSAASLLSMRAGDTIGHGLAAGHDPARDRALRGGKRLIRRGHQFDALIWLFALALRCRADCDAHDLRELEEFLRGEAGALYPRLRWTSLLEFDAALKTRGLPLQGLEDHRDSLRRIRRAEDASRERREALVELAPALASLDDLTRWAQGWVLGELGRRGVVLEFNPSSNWRIRGAASPSELPFLPILNRDADLTLATLATDNPGVLGTRIENEYAIVFEALISAGQTREMALRILERLRQVGLSRVYWPDVERTPRPPEARPRN